MFRNLLHCDFSFIACRASVAQGRVSTLPVVKDLQILEYLSPCCGARSPAPVVFQLGFERPEEALDDGVIPTVAPAAHAALDSMLAQHGLILLARVLRPPVGVVHEITGWRSVVERLPESRKD